MFARLSTRFLPARFVLIAAVVLAGLSIPTFAAQVPAAHAAGTPNVQLTKTVDANTLFGDAVGVTLTATNPDGPAGYNLTFADIIPAGTVYVAGSAGSFGSPSQTIALPDGTTKLVWSNVADLAQGTSVPLSYQFSYTGSAYDVGSNFTSTGSAYVNSSARTVPKIDGTTGTPVASSITGSADDSRTTTLVPFEVTKTEPSPEAELLRGVHDHKTVYTITIKNNEVTTTSNFGIIDYLPAGLEFLGCTSVDNSTAGKVEYPGSGRISDTAAPAMTNCVTPAAVTTITAQAGNTDGLTVGEVYTKVQWTGLGDLAPGAPYSMQYSAAIPLRENVDYAGNSTANLDNNTGALTSDEQALTNVATATGTYKTKTYSASGSKTVTAEDVAIQKAVDKSTIAHGQTSVWTMNVESSEYALSTSPITVKDTIPDGLDFVSSTPATTPTTQADGTLLATWTLPAFTAKNSTTTIKYTTTTRSTYRAGGPVSAQDSWSNNVSLASTSTVITDNNGGTSTLSTPDDSSASQSAGPVQLTKEVSTPATTTSTCPTTDGSFAKAVTGYHPGDVVCYRITATFPADLNTIGNTIQDFLPDGFTYQSYAFTSQSTVGDADVTFTAPTASAPMNWKLDDAASGAKFQVIVKTKIAAVTAASDLDLTANLAKMTYKNSKGKVFQLRDDADATLASPELALDKGIVTLNGAAVTGAPVGTVSAQAGDTVGYRVAVTNTGHQDAVNTSVRDVLPAQFSCSDVSAISDSGSCTSGATNWSTISVAAGATVYVTYTVTIPANAAPSDSYTNTAGIRSYQGQANDGSLFTFVPSNNIDTALESQANSTPARDTAVVTVAAAGVVKTSTTSVTESGNSATQAAVGEQITFSITTTIPQGTTLAGNPAVTDRVPTNYEIVGTPTFTVAGGAAQDATVTGQPASGQTVTAPLGATYSNTRNSGADQIVLTITVRVLDSAANTRGKVITNTGTLTYQNAAGTTVTRPNSTTNTIVEPNLGQTKTSNVAGGKVTAGQTVTFTLTTTNALSGGGTTNVGTAHEVVVTDVLPADLTPVNYAPGTYDSTTRTLTFTQATLAPGATAVFTYTAQVANPIVSSNAITNTATATATSLAGTDANERTAASTTNAGYTSAGAVTLMAPDLSIVKTNTTPGNRTIGESSTYSLAVTIPAGTLAYDTTVLDTLPTGQAFGSFVSSSCASGASACSPAVTASVIGTPSASDRTVGFFLGDLTPASSVDRVVTITYTAIVTTAASTGDTLTNSALVGYDSTNKTGDPTTVPTAASFDVRSNQSVAAVPVVEPKLTLDKSVLDASGNPVSTRRAKPGQTLTYTIAVKNTGTGTAYATKVTDTPNKHLTDFASTGAGTVTDGDPSDGSLAWTIASITPGATATVRYTLTVPTTFTAADENPTGPEITNSADVASYQGVDPAAQVDGRMYKTYTDVPADTANVELDLASIGDRVWFDTNGNGEQNTGEPGIVGAKVTVTFAGADGIFGTADDEVATTTTGTDGAWTVSNLPGGQYKVAVDPTTVPAGTSPSYDLDDGKVTPNGQWVGSLAENAVKDDVDFGYSGAGSIGDLVWFDQNKDGVKDPTEPGLPGADVTVTWAGPDGILGNGDDVVYTTTTGTDGKYTVDHLPTGTYSVAVNGQPTGYDVVSGPSGASASSTTTLTAGQNRVDQDFGYAGTGSIGDYVWFDKNGDGIQDATEQPVVGASLELTWFGPDGVAGGGDDATFTTTTDATGHYSFDNLLPGKYSVAVTGGLPKVVTNSYDEDGNHDSVTPVTLSAGEKHTTADFGYKAVSAIGDRVWWDVNKDGVQDASEPGFGGVTVTITGGGLTFSTTTDSDGNWLIENIPDADYTVTVDASTLPAGFAPTYDADGTATPNVSTVSLVGSNLDQDFGYAGPRTIGDTVWLDQDGDGVQDASGEPGIPGVGVTLTWFGPDGVAGGGDDVAFTTTTDADGHYSFGGLPDGAYSVTLDKSTFPAGTAAGYDLDGGNDATTKVTLAGTDVTTADFGLVGTGSIGDLVWLDRNADGKLDPNEKGIPGVGVDVRWAGLDGLFDTADDQVYSTTTAADGSYSVDGLPAGDYRVTVDNATLPAGLVITHDEDNDLNGVDTFSLPSGADHTTANFAYTGVASIGDTVYLDTDGDGTQGPGEQGVPGQRVDLVWGGPDGIIGTADDQTFTTTTDADGKYLFEHLPDGAFRVSVVGGIADSATNSGDPDGGTASSADVTLTGGMPNLDQDFGYHGTNAIGDTVWWDRNGDGKDQSTEPRLAGVGVRVTWYGPDGVAGGGDDITFATTTDASGKYLVDGLPNGKYGVAVVSGIPAGLTPSADASGAVDGKSTVTLTGNQTNLDQDFGYSASGQIGDTVWLDSNGDGKKGAGESGIPKVTVTLTWAGPDGVFGTADDQVQTTKTDAKGAYLFDRLPAGDFRVALTNLPTGLTATLDPDKGIANESTLTLSAGQKNLDQDFGYRGSATVGDTIYVDLNGDGKQTGNEPGLPGLTVTARLGGADGVVGTADDVILTTTTDKNGHYSFTGLPAGPVQVSYDTSGLPKGDKASSDLDGGSPSSTTVTLTTGETNLDVDFVVKGTSSLTGTVFDDKNGNGKQDPGEKGIGGVTVVITYDGPDGPVVVTTTTNPDGTWSVPNLPAGPYQVTIDPGTVPKGLHPSTGTTGNVLLTPGATASVALGESAVAALAFTGSDVAGTLGIALSLLLGGLAAFVIARRRPRRRRSTHVGL